MDIYKNWRSAEVVINGLTGSYFGKVSPKALPLASIQIPLYRFSFSKLLSCYLSLALQQAENNLLRCVGLCEHRG